MTDLGDLDPYEFGGVPNRDVLLNAEIRDRISTFEDDLIRIRRTLHARPELAFQEHATADLVANVLKEWGIPARTGVGGTGVVGLIEGGLDGGPTIAVRADMDALPITEAVDVPFVSREPGRMHACGHDVHTAILLGVARVARAVSERFRGRIKLIFQPAEETLEGARAMIEDGVLDHPPVDAILGFHNWPILPGGAVGYNDATVFASSDSFDIVVEGVSGHAAHPHKARDAVVAAAHLVMQIQTLVSRERDPLHPAVVSIGQIHGGTARNILPTDVRLEGTVRTHDAVTRTRMRNALERMVHAVEPTFGLRAHLEYCELSPPLRSDPDYQARVLKAARSIAGAENVVRLPNGSMGSEDFALYAERVPAVYLRLGSGGEGAPMLHSAKFNPDQSCIAVGVAVLARAVAELVFPF